MSDEKNLILIMIGSGKKPLAIYTPFKGEFIQICELTLKQVTPNGSASINCGEYLIYYINENNITYLIMTMPTYQKATAIGCIESVQKELKDILYGKNLDNIEEYGLNNELKEKLKMKYDYYNENTQVTSEALERLKIELNKMKDEVFKANEELMKRNDKLQEMEVKANEMAEESETYKKNAFKVVKTESKRKIWVYVGIILAVLIVAYAIVCIACNSFTFECGSQ